MDVFESRVVCAFASGSGRNITTIEQPGLNKLPRRRRKCPRQSLLAMLQRLPLRANHRLRRRHHSTNERGEVR